jgi:hypothetical protein
MSRERALRIVLVSVGLIFVCGLSADSDGEARPCAGDDDEPLRHSRRLLAAWFSPPLGAPQPNCLHGVVELGTRGGNVHASLAQHDLASGTDGVDRARRYRSHSDRVGSGQATGRAGIHSRSMSYVGIA